MAAASYDMTPANDGVVEAMVSLGKMHRDGRWFGQDRAAAIKWFQKAQTMAASRLRNTWQNWAQANQQAGSG